MGTGTSLITVYDHHYVIGVFYLCSRESTVYFLTPFFFNITKKKKNFVGSRHAWCVFYLLANSLYICVASPCFQGVMTL